MSLKCQKDSYLRSYRSRVASCRPAENVGNGEGKYEVVLDDTVLFPEGGGQVNFTDKVSLLFPILALLYSSRMTEERLVEKRIT